MGILATLFSDGAWDLMGYLVLARKYRPQRFEDVVGQEHVTRTLQNAIRLGRMGHAFLFSGPRGVGKTTTARLLARAINCDEGPTPTPCGRCRACETIIRGRSSDVLEIDGASNRGIDEVRSLQDLVGHRPTDMRCRVCTIDEVHMLTMPAFNALLKVIEEPPEHVKFIFATTEPEKVPPTIASRCQRYTFRLVPHETLRANLARLIEAEGFEAEDEAVDVLARCARGSLRDGQSLLDQALSASEGVLTVAQVRSLLGTMDPLEVGELVASILRGDQAALIKRLEAFFAGGASAVVLFDALLELMAAVRVFPLRGAPSGTPPSEAEQLRALADLTDGPSMDRLVQILLGVEAQLRRSRHPRLLLEMTLLGMASVPRMKPLEELIEAVQALRAQGSAGSAPGGRSTSGNRRGERQQRRPTPERPGPPATPAMPGFRDKLVALREAPRRVASAAPEEPPARAPVHPPSPTEAAAAQRDGPTAEQVWPDVISALQRSLGQRAAIELRTQAVLLGETSDMVGIGLRAGPRAAELRQRLLGPWRHDLENAFRQLLHRPVNISVDIREIETADTLADRERRQRSEAERERHERLIARPIVQQAMRLFDATVESTRTKDVNHG